MSLKCRIKKNSYVAVYLPNPTIENSKLPTSKPLFKSTTFPAADPIYFSSFSSLTCWIKSIDIINAFSSRIYLKSEDSKKYSAPIN